MTCMGKGGGGGDWTGPYVLAGRAADVQEAGLGALHQPLALVRVLLLLQGRVQEVGVEETHCDVRCVCVAPAQKETIIKVWN